MSTDLVVPSARAEWLQRRRRGVGSSDVAQILGLSPWGSPYACWLEKVSDRPENEPTDDMTFGRYAEAMVLAWFTDHTGLVVKNQQLEVQHQDYAHFIATLDGTAHESLAGDEILSTAIGVVEAKSTRDSEEEWAAGIPIQYRIQTTWQLIVTGMSHAFVPTLHRFSGRFHLYEVELDQADVDYVVPRVTEWWERYVVTGNPPPIDDSLATTRALKEQWPTPEGTVDADEPARELVARLHAHKAMAKVTERNIDQAENELRALLADREALVDGENAKGRPKVIASWKSQNGKGVTDWAPIHEQYPDLAAVIAAHTTTSSIRVLRVPAPKES